MLSPLTSGNGQPGNRMVTLFGTQYGQGAFVPDNRGPAPGDHYAPAGRPGTRVPHAWIGWDVSTLDLAGPGLSLLTGPDARRWTDEASRLGLRLVAVADPEWLTTVELPSDGALLLRPDAIVAWHSTSDVPLAHAVARVLDTGPATRA
jgi:putative polyketide hydroxylase